ncbi:ATP-binding protein [Shewanella sp. AS1]|uniref:hybrid sensor histidine kinase/response regulator n=1 Tax=Shewanella sp. AS1 TaxID=2907626 RepID=UPI001F261F90|nr:hybrid sensor histidine kinase/response regulator [Shewanella sp. AS1]MCE9680273.1 ATP-binding protein [Shewanella sp. AS1]
MKTIILKSLYCAILSCALFVKAGHGLTFQPSSLHTASPAIEAKVIQPSQRHHAVAQRVTSLDGLSQNAIEDMAIDEFDRLWVATQDGLNLFDANRIRIFQADENQLSSGFIYGLQADHHGGMWVATRKGLERIDIRDLSIQHFAHLFPQGKAARIINWDQDHIAVLVNGKLHTINTLNFETGELNITNAPIVDLLRAGDLLLIRLKTGFIHLNLATRQQETLSFATQLMSQVLSFTIDQQNQVWFVTKVGLTYRCDKQACLKIKFETQTAKETSIGKIVSDDDKIYAISDMGLFILDDDLSNVSLLESDKRSGLFLSRPFNHSLLVTKQKNLLLGLQDGLYYISANYKSIASYLDQDMPLLQELTAVINLDNQEQQMLVVAGAKDLVFLSESQGNLQLRKRLPYPKNFEPSNFINTGKHIYLNSYRSGTIELNNMGWRRLNDTIPELATNMTMLTDAIEFPNGQQLLLHTNQLSLTVPEGEQHSILWTQPIPAMIGYRMILLNEHLYIATQSEGLLVTKLSPSDHKPSVWQTLLADKLLAGLTVQDDKLLAMTIGSGIWQLTYDGKQWQSAPIADNDKLLNSTILCMTPTSDDGWLVSTNNGIALLDKQLALKRTLTLFDGLSHKENYQNGCTNINGHPVVLGLRGLSVIHGDLVASENKQIHWVSGKADNMPISLTTDALSLTAPKQIDLQFAIGSLPLKARTEFQYRLFDTDPHWKHLENTELNLPYLTPGKYNLSVQAKLYDGNYSNTLTLPFEVKPPIWKRGSALLLYFFAAMALLGWLFQLRWRSQKERLNLLETQKSLQDNYAKSLEEQVRQRTEELKAKQAEALQLQRDKARFITGASHDLKNLVGLLRLNVTNLIKAKSPARKETQALLSVSDTLGDMMENIIQLSKLDAGAVTPAHTYVNLAQLLQSMHQQYLPACQEKNLRFNINCPEPVTVSTDQHLLSRLLHNLVDNSIKNLQIGGELTLSAIRQQADCVIQIRDNGTGLSEEIKQRWPEPFLRGNTHYPGSGLGLSIVAAIAQVLNINIKLLDAETKGACFQLSLPRSLTQTESPSPLSDLLIAVIEDDPQQREWLVSKLTNNGYKVHAFSSAQALMAKQDTDYQAIVSDVDLGKNEDGVDYLERYRQKLVHPCVLIYVSADASVQNRLKGIADVHFLLKPLKLSRLFWLLKRGLRN